MLMDILVNTIQDKIYFMITLWLYIALHVNFDWFSHISIAGKDKINFFAVLASPTLRLSIPHNIMNLFFWSFLCICLTMVP